MLKTKIKKGWFLGALLLLVIFAPFYSLRADNVFNSPKNTYQQLKDDIAQKEAEIKKLEKQAAAYKKMIKTKSREKDSLSRELGIISAEIKRISTEIQLTKGKIDVSKDKIASLGLAIDEQKNKIRKNKKSIAAILQEIYKLDQKSDLEILLASDNLSDFFNQLNATESIRGNLSGNLKELKKLKEKIVEEKKLVEEQKAALEEFDKSLESKQEEFNEQKNNKVYLLEKTKGEEKKYQNLYSEIKRKRREIQKDIYELEDKLRLTIDPSSLPSPRSGVLAWPLRGTVTQGYGPTSQTGFINNVYNFHNGIDIAAGGGNPIRAARGGEVIAAGNNGRYAYGKWLAIKHDNGLTTLYAHLSSQTVAAGQKVKQGEIIGYEGRTGFVTGYHLHFTVYATNTFRVSQRWFGALPLGGSINPLKYL